VAQWPPAQPPQPPPLEPPLARGAVLAALPMVKLDIIFWVRRQPHAGQAGFALEPAGISSSKPLAHF